MPAVLSQGTKEFVQAISGSFESVASILVAHGAFYLYVRVLEMPGVVSEEVSLPVSTAVSREKYSTRVFQIYRRVWLVGLKHKG